MIVLTVDVEPDYPPYLNTDKGLSGLEKIVGLIKNNYCSATFFVTARYLQEHPHIVGLLEGFEVGCHGLEHVDYTSLSGEEVDAHFGEARDIFKSHGINVTGFRAPYAKVNKRVLRRVFKHFEYDSSKTIWHHGRYELMEYPIYTGGKAFGAYPFLFKQLLHAPFDDMVFFTHPWEYDNPRFSKIAQKRKWMKLLGYSEKNYVKNLKFLLKKRTVSIKSLMDSE